MTARNDTTQRTAGPWFIDEPVFAREGYVAISSKADEWIGFAEVVVRMEGDTKDKPAGRANAAFIVEACNGWDNPEALRARLAELEAK